MNTKYINHFFSLKASQDLLPFFTGCKKNAAKEITESFGAYHNVLEKIGPIDENWVVVSVGDGKRPRTGSVFRFLTRAASVISIDPELDTNWFCKDLWEIYKVCPRDFFVIQNKVEEILDNSLVEFQSKIKDKNLLILGVHSHARISDSIKTLAKGAKSVSILWMPCCSQVESQYLNKGFVEKCEFFTTYRDPEIWSAKNQVYIWKNIPV